MNFTERVPCPACKSEEANTVRASRDIVRCGNCGLVYLRTRPPVAELEASYQTYASTPGSHMRIPETISEIRTTGLRRNYFMSDVLAFTGATRGKLLDIGSGWGAFLLNAREHDFKVEGVEICTQMADFATNMLGIYTHKRQLEATVVPDANFQVVTLIHSLEHLPNQATALGYIRRILEPGGLICGIVPNFASWASEMHKDKWLWLDPIVHYTHYTPETLRSTLWAFGFNVEKITTATGDFDRKQLPGAPTLGRLEAEMKGEEIRWIARKL